MEEDYEDDRFGAGKENEDLKVESRLRRRSNFCLQRLRPTSYPPSFSFGASSTPLYLKRGLMDRKPQKLIEPICEEISSRIGRKVKFADEAGKQLASYIEIPNKLERFGFRSLTNINAVFEEAMGKDINQMEQVFDSAFSMKNLLQQKMDSSMDFKENTDSALGCKRKYNTQSSVSFPKEKFPRAIASAAGTSDKEKPCLSSFQCEKDHSLPQNIKIRKHSLDGCSVSEAEEETNPCDISPESSNLHSSSLGTTSTKPSSLSESNCLLQSMDKIGVTRSWDPSDYRKQATQRVWANDENIPCSNVSLKQEIPIFHQGKSSTLNPLQKTNKCEKKETFRKRLHQSSDQKFEELILKLHSAGQSSDSSGETSNHVTSPVNKVNQTSIPVYHNNQDLNGQVNTNTDKNTSEILVYGHKVTGKDVNCSSVHTNGFPLQELVINDIPASKQPKKDPNEELSFTLLLGKGSATLDQNNAATGVSVDITLPFSSSSPNKCDKTENVMTSSFDENPNISFTIISPTPSSIDVTTRSSQANDLNTDRKSMAVQTSSTKSVAPCGEKHTFSDSKISHDFISETNSAIEDILSVFDEVSFPEFRDQSKMEEEKHVNGNLSCNTLTSGNEVNSNTNSALTSTYDLESNTEDMCNTTGMLGVNHGSESGYGTHSFISDDFFNEDSLSIANSAFELDDVFEEDTEEVQINSESSHCLSSSKCTETESYNEYQLEQLSDLDTGDHIKSYADELTSDKLACSSGSISNGCSGEHVISKDIVDDKFGYKSLNTNHNLFEIDIGQTSTVTDDLNIRKPSITRQSSDTKSVTSSHNELSENVSANNGQFILSGYSQNDLSSCQHNKNSKESVYMNESTIFEGEHLQRSIFNEHEHVKEKTDSLINDYPDVHTDSNLNQRILDHRHCRNSIPQVDRFINCDKVVTSSSSDNIEQINTTLGHTTDASNSEETSELPLIKKDPIIFSKFPLAPDKILPSNSDSQSTKDDVVESSDMEFYLPKNIARTLVDCLFKQKGYPDTSDSDSSETGGKVARLKVQERRARCVAAMAKKLKGCEKSVRKRAPSKRTVVDNDNSGNESDVESFTSDGSQTGYDWSPQLQLLDSPESTSPCRHSKLQIFESSSEKESESVESASLSSTETDDCNVCDADKISHSQFIHSSDDLDIQPVAHYDHTGEIRHHNALGSTTSGLHTGCSDGEYASPSSMSEPCRLNQSKETEHSSSPQCISLDIDKVVTSSQPDESYISAKPLDETLHITSSKHCSMKHLRKPNQDNKDTEDMIRKDGCQTSSLTELSSSDSSQGYRREVFKAYPNCAMCCHCANSGSSVNCLSHKTMEQQTSVVYGTSSVDTELEDEDRDSKATQNETDDRECESVGQATDLRENHPCHQIASDHDLNVTVIITSEGKLIVQDE